MEPYVLAILSLLNAAFAAAAALLIAAIVLAARARMNANELAMAEFAVAPTRDLPPVEPRPLPMPVAPQQLEPIPALESTEWDARAFRLDTFETPVGLMSFNSQMGPSRHDSGPLPIPIAPEGVEPIPEREQTEVLYRRPDWVDESDWVYALPRN